MTVLDEWQRLRKQLDSQDAKVLRRLINAYGQGYDRLIPEIDALREFLTAQLQSGKVTVKGLQASAVYKNLMREVERELTAYQAILRNEITTAAQDAARAGLAGGRLLTRQAIADALGVAVADLPADAARMAGNDALAFLAQYLKKDGVLFGKIDALSSYHAAEISQGIIAQVGVGLNPRDIANWITDAYGMGLTDSLRMARTVQLYSYRESNNAVQVANADVLQGVVWCAELDDRCCMSCVSQHGQVFPVGTVCDDHFNGRCAMLPLAIGADNPITVNGRDWFDMQSEAKQREMMGDGKYDAFKAGKFEFSALSVEATNDVYGPMRHEASLKDLLGE